MINLAAIHRTWLQRSPFSWAPIDGLFAPRHARALAASYPADGFQVQVGGDSEKSWRYLCRELVRFGASSGTRPEQLSPAWRNLAVALTGEPYRAAMSLLVGRDLTALPMEVNVFRYGLGSYLGPHVDLPEKLVTHVLYFNEDWDPHAGGCIRILGSSDPDDVAAIAPPNLGSSVVLVRSDCSWHAVDEVRSRSADRRSVTVTFYSHGSVSTMWPPGTDFELVDVD